jgi:hypothetical protein
MVFGLLILTKTIVLYPSNRMQSLTRRSLYWCALHQDTTAVSLDNVCGLHVDVLDHQYSPFLDSRHSGHSGQSGHSRQLSFSVSAGSNSGCLCNIFGKHKSIVLCPSDPTCTATTPISGPQPHPQLLFCPGDVHAVENGVCFIVLSESFFG